MAKKGSNLKKETLARIQRTEAYAEKVRLMFAQTVNDILALNKTMPTLDEGVMYSFDGESLKKQKEVERLLRRLHSSATMAIQQGIKLEWEQANVECDKLIESAFGKKVLFNPKFSAWTNRNEAARDAFINRTEKGMNLSDRIWKPVRQLRDEMEVAMTISIGEGEGASSMSRKVRSYLNDPDLMFRRFRYKDDAGEWQRKWKKRIKDEETGKYRWIDYDRDDYKTGAGVYKSSAKNAMRVTRTETNIAYRRADNARWQDMDFVLGQRVQLSKSHPREDICDKLQGDYPKDFIFDGWHPQCFCFCTPILISEDEMAKVTEVALRGEKYEPQGKPITDYPDSFKDWVTEHSEAIAKARQRGTEPYFITNNAQVIDNILNPEAAKKLTSLEIAEQRHNARTPEQVAAIRNRARMRQKSIRSAKQYLSDFEGMDGVDTSALRDAYEHGRWEDVRSEALVLARMKRQIIEKEIAIKTRTAISILMPDKLKPQSAYLNGEDYTFAKDFFDLLDPNKPIRLEILDSDSGSYSSFVGDLVHIAGKKRGAASPWECKAVIYHEYGHCIDAQRELWCDPKLIAMRKAQIKMLKKEKEYTVYERNWSHANGGWYYTRVKKEMSMVEYIDKRLVALSEKIAWMDDNVFAKRGFMKKDVLEQIGSTRDTIKSLVVKYGGGHSTAYFKRTRMKETEYLAHAFENAFLGNRVFRKYLPDIYAEMIAYIKTLKPLK